MKDTEKRNFLKSKVRRCTGLLVVIFAQVIMSVVYGQTTNLTIQEKNVTVKEVLTFIEKNSQVIFFYVDNDIDLNRVVSIDVKDQSISNVLEELFKDSQNTFRIDGNQVYIRKKAKTVEEQVKPAENTKIISGIITDEENKAVIGATVLLDGTAIGTITDIDGYFQLKTPENGLIKITYLGYQPQVIDVKGRTIFNISLVKSIEGLDEVVVVGYGTQKKISVTGAISTVGSDLLVKSPNASISNTLAGRVTGVSTVQYSGEPGADEAVIYVRGLGSLSSDASSPLVLVDGVERPFSQLDPNEVESISILKDASATAVYGIRGANGVIIVTTKRGTEGTPRINFTMSAGLQSPSRLIEMADSYTYALKYNQAQLWDGMLENQLMFNTDAIEAFRTNSDPYIYPNTNWVKDIVKPASLQSQYNVNISGGNKVAKYFVSLGYLNQEGQFNTFNNSSSYNYGYNRYNYRANVDVQLTKTTTLVITTGGRTEIRQQPGQMAYDGTFTVLYNAVPFSGSIRDDKLYVTGPYEIGMAELEKNNGATAVGYGTGYKRSNTNVMNLDFGLTQNLDIITKGLSWRIKYSDNSTTNDTKLRKTAIASYTPLYLTNVPGDYYGSGDKTVVFRRNGADGTMNYEESSWNSRNYYMESAFAYDRAFGNHQVTGLLLYNQSKIYYPSVYTDIPVGYVGIAARATYNYKQKYLFDLNLGYNGSENFAPGNRFGFFPAVSLGWVATEEEFIKKSLLLELLKLRFSYGEVGNDRQGNARFLYMPDSYIPSTEVNGDILTGGYNFGIDDPTWRTTAGEGKIGNPGVTWEKAQKANIGIDWWMLDGQLSLKGDIFYEYRNNILTTQNNVPTLLSFNMPAVNIGEVENKGYEVEVKWSSQIGAVNYFISANISHARNKILFMDEIPHKWDYQYRTGHRVNQPFGYVFTGFWTEDEVARYNDLDAAGDRVFPDYSYTPKAGDSKYDDLNKDGFINDDDQEAIGFPDYPEYNFGLSCGLTYKGFDFSMMWTGATNVSRQMTRNWKTAFGTTGNMGLIQWLADNSWTPETAETALAPRISFTNTTYNTKTSSLWHRDASYLRLKNLEIGYSFGSIKKLGVSNLRIYANGYNLLTFDKLKFIDPESRTSSGDYPIMSLYNVGLNVNF